MLSVTYLQYCVNMYVRVNLNYILLCKATAHKKIKDKIRSFT